MGTIIFMVSIHLFHEVATLMLSFMPDKLQSREKNFFRWKDITKPLRVN